MGSESVHDWVEEGYAAPQRVIAYLRKRNYWCMCPGVYDHPFVRGARLVGPNTLTDGHYYWDKHAWEYVTKYHVRLPREFVDYVMSGEGDWFLTLQLGWE